MVFCEDYKNEEQPSLKTYETYTSSTQPTQKQYQRAQRRELAKMVEETPPAIRDFCRPRPPSKPPDNGVCITTHSLTSHENYRNRRGPRKNTGKSRRRARRAKKTTQQRSSCALSKELGDDVDDYRNDIKSSWNEDD